MATAPATAIIASQARSRLFESPAQQRAILCLILGLATLIVYNPVVHDAFISFDDATYIVANPHVRAGLTRDTIAWAFRSIEHANWHPLTWISHALDCQLFHLNPAGHHYTSVLLHAINALLIFLLFDTLTAMRWRSLLVAALFAVHPINVESVAWAAERKNVLCTVFFLVALFAYVRDVRRPGLKTYSLVAACFALALMAKPMAVTFPFVLLLLDYWPLGRTALAASATGLPTEKKSIRWLFIEKIPLLLLSAASAIVTIVAQRAGGAVHNEASLVVRAGNAVVSYSVYLRKAVWPSDLAIMYPFREQGLPRWEIALCCLLLVLITVVVLLRASARPYLAMGWFWFVGTLVPVIGLIKVGDQAMADRYAYIPLIGVFVAVLWLIADVCTRKRAAVMVVSLASLGVVTILAVRTRIQIGYWHDSITLWSHALQVTDRNFVAHDSLGADLLDQGRVQEAAAHFQAALSINPRDPFGHLDLGVCQKQAGNLQAAAANFQSALALTSDPSLRATAFSNLGTVYRRSGDYPRARENYEQALRLTPDSRLALTGMGLVLQKLGDLPQAVSYYARATRVEPSDIGYVLLAQALEKSGQPDEANAALRQAQQITRNPGALRQAVAHLLSE